jgi:hypothetical protein
MTTNEVSTLIRDTGGEVWKVTSQKGGLVLYCDINQTYCRIIILCPRQSPPKGSALPAFLMHIETNDKGLKDWLFQITLLFKPNRPKHYEH